MPWNDNSKPGPWGSPPPQGGSGGGAVGRGPGGPGGKGPFRRIPGGRGPGSGGPGPDIEDLLRRLNERLRQFFRGPDGEGIRPAAIAAAGGVAVALWALTGVYVVQPSEQAVVTTFGAYTRSEGPGLRYHLPAPIDRVEKVPVTSLKRLDVGGQPSDPLEDESRMLTGDENIVDLQFTVQWRVADAAKYLFRIRDQEDTVKDVAESAMREVIGQTPLQAILTTGRGEVQNRAEALMRETLNRYNSGVEIVEVQIRSAGPPKEVVPAFQQVASAGQEAESAVNEANTYRNRVINEAKGDASRILQSAQGYREQSIREAEGDAARFNQLYEQYRRAPAVTRQRLYTETMERVLGKSHNIIVDGKNTTAPVILPSEAFRPPARPGPAADSPPPPAPQITQGARQ